MHRHAVARILIATSFICSAPRVLAAEPASLRFDITAYRVEGSTLLTSEQIQATVTPFTGKQRDFGDIQRAVEALQAAYRKAGYLAVQVYLPEQELADGVVTLRVVEAKIASVSVKGNKYFDESNVRRSLPALKEGTAPSAPRIADNTQLVNENPAKKVRVVLRPSSEPNMVDAVAEVEDDKTWRVFATADNTGVESTGRYRAGIGLQHNNLFNRDQTFTAQYITSPDAADQVQIYSLGYRLPLYSLGDSIDVFAGYSNVDAATTQTPAGPLQFAGKGKVTGGRYNWLLARHGEYEHRVIFGLDYRVYENVCSFGSFGPAGCGAAGADVAVHPASVSYSGQTTSQRLYWSFYAALLRNIPGGPDGAEEDLQASRPGANGNYTIFRGGIGMVAALWQDFQFRARLDSQYTGDALIQGEQFGIGGWNSVRGFQEREIASDRGFSGSIELYTPDIGAPLGLKWANLRLLAFYDTGGVFRNDPVPGDITQVRIGSAGAGARFNIRKNFSLRADIATVLNAGGSQQKHDAMGHFGGVLSF